MDAGGSSAGSRTVRVGSVQKHVMEYQKILDNLTSEGTGVGSESETLKANSDRQGGVGGRGGGGGMIKIGDAEIPRMISPSAPNIAANDNLMRGSRGNGVGSVRSGWATARRREWCWYCQNEFPRELMDKLPVGGQDPQWVCKGCDARPARLE